MQALDIAPEYMNLKIVILLTIGFLLAGAFGYISHRLKLSPILGYLIAGYLIGPFSPGFTADLRVAEQLAEIGVILMLFSVGLHFKWHELINVKNIVIPGAVVQTAIVILVTLLVVTLMGWSMDAGFFFGLALSVVSFVELVHMLTDHNLLTTTQGHIAVGWVILEDIFAVLALLLIPTIAVYQTGGDLGIQDVALSVINNLLKFFFWIVLLFTLGRRAIRFLLKKMIETHSKELFLLAILAITFLIASGSVLFFGISIALGAFIAGMVIGETDVRHQVSATIAPLKDVFLVIFFLSIGMLFNPMAIVENLTLFLCALAIVLLIKPFATFLIVVAFKRPLATALTLAVALAQIGEFSFILAEEATRYNILPDKGYDIIVACALITIALNPVLFKFLKLEKFSEA